MLEDPELDPMLQELAELTPSVEEPMASVYPEFWAEVVEEVDPVPAVFPVEAVVEYPLLATPEVEAGMEETPVAAVSAWLLEVADPVADPDPVVEACPWVAVLELV